MPGMHTVFIRRKLGQEPVTLSAPVAAGDPGADLRRHHLPGTGDADRERAGRLHRSPKPTCCARRSARRTQALIKQELGRFVDRAMAPGPPDGAGRGTRRRRSRPSAATASTSRTRSRTRSSRTRRRGSRRTTPPSSWPPCSRSEIGNTDKVVQYINEARELGLEVLPPDVNESGFKFTVVGDEPDPVRARRGAQRRARRHRVDHCGPQQDGPFHDLWRLRRPDRSAAVQQAGDRVAHRGRRAATTSAATARQYLEALDTALRRGAAPPGGAGGGPGLPVRRGPGDGEARRARPPRRAPAGPRPSGSTREKEVIGFFISGHPLERFRAEVELFGTRTTATLARVERAPGHASRRW